MSGAAFSEQYARVYDLLHADKPYREETDFVLAAAEKILGARPTSAIDLACGTGRHVAELCRSGLFVQGNDLSEGMLASARRRLEGEGLTGYILTASPMQEVAPQRTGGFELATAFYTALGYLTEPEDWRVFLSHLREILKPGGLLFADFWSAHKMSRDFSPSRTRQMERDGLRVTRTSNVSHEPAKNALRVRFGFEIDDAGSGAREHLTEEHLVRYFSEAEVRTLFTASGLRVVGAGPFFDGAERIEDAWNFWVLAQRV